MPLIFKNSLYCRNFNSYIIQTFIIYIYPGKFTELGEDISMRGCIERCCNTPLCDVSFMFSDKCYAVGCYDEALCQAVVAKPSNLNPKLAYVSKYRANAPLALYNMPSGCSCNSKYLLSKLSHNCSRCQKI